MTCLSENLIDTSSLFLAGEAVAELTPSQKRASPDYAALTDVLARIRARAGWDRGGNTAFAAVDPSNDAQRRFVDALRHSGLEVDAVDYRSAFPSPPPQLGGRRDLEQRQSPSFVARIATIIGLAARRSPVHLLVVTHHFELYSSLLDLAHRVDGARVGMAYFGSLLEHRWQRATMKDEKSTSPGLEFFDLDPWSNEIFGINILPKSSPAGEILGGLSRF